jgi:membrane fusion protein, multidrug efflux system
MTRPPTEPPAQTAAPAAAPPQPPQAPQAALPAPSRRRSALLLLTAAVLLAGGGAAVWWALFHRQFESTDNAYVQAPVVQITPQVAGTVLAVLVDDTDRVAVGQTLVRMDPADAQLALARAEAQLAQTVREVRTLYTQNATLDAGVRQRQAELSRVQAELARAQDDVDRRRPLLASGAVSGEDLQHAEAAVVTARNTLAVAQSALAAAREQATTQRVLTQGIAVEQHPSVARAAAAVREAFLALQRTALPSPVAGQIVRRSVQVGQRLAPGAPVMSVVRLERAWVEANFKEGQLRRMRVGQPVTLQADLYGSDVRFRGRVTGLGAGTGAAFALLPAQNATGNWIKVVQRVPVRVELDPQDLAAHPLRVGLSMHATVDVGDENGTPVAASPSTSASAGAASAPSAGATDTSADTNTDTNVFQPTSDAADRRVQQVIAAQLGRPARR